MTVLTTADEVQAQLRKLAPGGRRVGFVPTMGALHRGHETLVKRCAADGNVCVVSVFVNPSQFNEESDLTNYPRTPAADEDLLRRAGCELLYRPSVADVYPRGIAEQASAELDFGELTRHWEGSQRPGHFAGVAQVVRRLLDIVRPHSLYLGQKDYQQVAVIRRLIQLLGLGVQTVVVPTVREPDGLALSSRNRRLSPDERLAASYINRQLAAITEGVRAGWPVRQLERLALDFMDGRPLLSPEYVAVVHADDLRRYRDGEPFTELAAITAVRVGQVRLIDNRIVASDKL